MRRRRRRELPISNFTNHKKPPKHGPKSIIFAKNKGFREFIENIRFFRTSEWSLNLGREEIRV
jgi:hypothetical protein